MPPAPGGGDRWLPPSGELRTEHVHAGGLGVSDGDDVDSEYCGEDDDDEGDMSIDRSSNKMGEPLNHHVHMTRCQI